MFRKLTCLFCVLICVLAFWSQNNTPVFYKYGGEYELYLGSASSLAQTVKVNGGEYRLYTSVMGEACTVNSNASVNDILKDFDATVVKTESAGEVINYYAYSPKIKYVKTAFGKRFNLHIAVSGEKIKLGAPMIFGSF